MTPTPAYPDPRLVELLRGMNAAMPPWDAYRWFDTPTERVLSGLVTGDRIAEHDVRRVVLLIGLNGAADSCRITLTPGTGSGNGFVLNSGQPSVKLVHAVDGPLTQVDWFVGSAPVGPLCVVEVRLRAWPGEPGIG